MSRKVVHQIEGAAVFVENVLRLPELQGLFARHGRDAAYFAAGRVLYQRARDLHRRQQVEYGNKCGATQVLQAARRGAEEVYIHHLRLARIAFKNDSRAAQTLQLKGTRERTLTAWINQVAAFYDNLLTDEDLRAGIESIGVTKKELQQGKAAIEAVAVAARDRMIEKGQAQQTTQDRKAAMADLAAWMSESTELARVLLADEPQRLEQLGLLVRS